MATLELNVHICRGSVDDGGCARAGSGASLGPPCVGDGEPAGRGVGAQPGVVGLSFALRDGGLDAHILIQPVVKRGRLASALLCTLVLARVLKGRAIDFGSREISLPLVNVRPRLQYLCGLSRHDNGAHWSPTRSLRTQVLLEPFRVLDVVLGVVDDGEDCLAVGVCWIPTGVDQEFFANRLVLQ